MNLLTFLSDFGQQDGYCGSVKGIMLSINPRLHIVDICHSIQPYHIEQAAYILAGYYADFPRETVHLVVVDPGVGSGRLPLIIRTSSYFFVGPDNGLFTYVLQKEAYKAYQINILRLKQKRIITQLSSTFHARDIFGPAAALLSQGTLPASLGDSLTQTPLLLADKIRQDQNKIRARVILIDHFGNIITAYTQNQFKAAGNKKINSIRFKDTALASVHHTYNDVPPGSPLALWNSTGYLEIAVNQGNAAQLLNCSNELEYVDIILE